MITRISFSHLMLPFIMMFVVFSGCGNKAYDSDKSPEVNVNSIENQSPNHQMNNEQEWISLFDGKSLAGWRGYKMDFLPKNWVIEGETLKSEVASDHHGDIIYGLSKFENFDLRWEWKIAKGGNSGVMYHVLEDDKYNAPYQTGPEYQLIDDMGFDSPLEDWQKTGNDYAMYSASERNIKPSGEWNTSRIVFTPEKVTYWLNEMETVSFVPWSEDWHLKVSNGKWKDHTDYGLSKSGYICLQDHGSDIWFRNIRIKSL